MYIQVPNKEGWVAEIYGDDVKGRKVKYRICPKYSKKFSTDYEYGGIGNAIPATEKQIAHLKACIAADKYVEWNENMLIPQYEIY